MDKNLKWVNEQKIIRTIEALEKNNMNGYLVENEEELIDKIKDQPAGEPDLAGHSSPAALCRLDLLQRNNFLLQSPY